VTDLVWQLLAAVALLTLEIESPRVALEQIAALAFEDGASTMLFAVPALFYTLQNNLWYYALSHLDPVTAAGAWIEIDGYTERDRLERKIIIYHTPAPQQQLASSSRYLVCTSLTLPHIALGWSHRWRQDWLLFCSHVALE